MIGAYQAPATVRGHAGSSKRGGGVIAIALLVGCWTLMRFAMWESPLLPLPADDLPSTSPLSAVVSATQPDSRSETSPTIAEDGTPFAEPWNGIPAYAPLPSPIPSYAPTIPDSAARNRAYTFERGNYEGSRSLGHANLLRMGYFARPTGVGNSAPVNRSVPPPFIVANAEASARELRATPAPSRWTVDSWAMWREGGNVPLVAGQSSYGRSQAGLVVRYRLGERDGHAPQAYVRGTSALEGPLEREMALGASIRPLPALPVRVAIEGRVSETERGTEARAAGYAVTELPTARLPGGVVAQAYAQAGYVTGDFETPFVDGQARITRPIQLDDDFRLDAGAGVWGGAQEDAARLDLGPTAGLSFRIGAARGRLSADYRFRVAGDAEPASGPALTLTAGF